MSRYSSFNIEECIRRVNEFIMILGYDFSPKQIIDIYSHLYESFGIVFNVTATQIYNLDTLNSTELSNYYNINSAILIIVNSMTTQDIFKVLNGYANYVAVFNKQTRFDIKKISSEYNRIIPVLNQLIIDGVVFR
jgi:ribosome-interacting GTPase 1